MGQRNSHSQLYPGDILEFPRNKYFSHFGIYYGERDGVAYMAHLTPRDSDDQFLIFGRALNSGVKLDPLNVVGKKFKVCNYLDGQHPPRDFYTYIKPEIDEVVGKKITFDILFHNSEHQATQFRYGVKRSKQIETVYEKIVPTWRKPFEKKIL
uniref:LRAT domain-containing protein n=1 Tax=Denticeps clupeoides TaxID=299321 RepID=A0AAY4BBT2_9TELE